MLTAGAIDDPLLVAWQLLRLQHTAALRVQLAEKYAPSTANLRLVALRGVLRVAWQLGTMPADDYQKAVDLRPVRGERLASGRHVPEEEIKALLSSCESTRQGARDAAVLALLYGCGLRRAELCQLQMGDYDAAAGALVVNGKGGKQRRLPLPGGTVQALAAWLNERGREPGPLFFSVGGRRPGGQLTGQAVYHLLRKRAALAGLADVSPHDLRRTYAGELLDRGADIVTVQKLLGHASIQTTAGYDRRGEETKRRAVELLQVPYIQQV